jgi:hypothetical protein
VSYTIENAVFQWEEGYRNLQAARSNPSAYQALGQAVVAVESQLRRRLGSSFSISELASVYHAGTDWTLEVAMSARRDPSPAWDSSTAVDAAFYLYMREAVDFGGGSLRYPQA